MKQENSFSLLNFGLESVLSKFWKFLVLKMASEYEIDLFVKSEDISFSDVELPSPDPSSENELVVVSDQSSSDLEVEFECISVKPNSSLSPDVIIDHEGMTFEIGTQPCVNLITGSNLKVDGVFERSDSKGPFSFRKGFNMHTLYLIWGRLDQLCLRRHRFLRLMTLLNMLKLNNSVSSIFSSVVQEEAVVNEPLRRMRKTLREKPYRCLRTTGNAKAQEKKKMSVRTRTTETVRIFVFNLTELNTPLLFVTSFARQLVHVGGVHATGWVTRIG